MCSLGEGEGGFPESTDFRPVSQLKERGRASAKTRKMTVSFMDWDNLIVRGVSVDFFFFFFKKKKKKKKKKSDFSAGD